MAALLLWKYRIFRLLRLKMLIYAYDLKSFSSDGRIMSTEYLLWNARGINMLEMGKLSGMRANNA